MKTATVTTEGGTQIVRLPQGIHLRTSTVQVRQAGDAIVLEPLRPDSWPPDFFDAIHISDPAFDRPEQGQLPEIKAL